MKLLFSVIAATAALCAVADTPVATSADCAYALDTEGGWPRSIKTAADVAALPLDYLVVDVQGRVQLVLRLGHDV